MGDKTHRSRYRVGERVRVRSAADVAKTLDENGTLDGLPFMPEMTSFCGRVFTVRASAHKTCAYMHGLRAMDDAVHLESVRCEGFAHGGCQSRCPVFWKDAWLEPATEHHERESPGPSSELDAKAARSTRLHARTPEAGTYSCQGTELLEATRPLASWSLRQYWDDVRSGNVSARSVLSGLPLIVFNKLQYISRRRLPAPLRFRGGRLYPDIVGTRSTTPDIRLGIEAGAAVRIRTHAEILDTLNASGHNRGLAFDLDMVPFCGAHATVHHRVETRVDEETGAITHLKNPCLVLDGLTCRGKYHRFCPRGVDMYWREAWLEPEAVARERRQHGERRTTR